MANYTVSVTLQGKDNLSHVLKDVNNELDNLETNGGKAQTGLGGLKDAVLGLGAAFTVAQVAQKAVELYNLGTAANNAQNTFFQLSGGAEAAGQTLAKLRTATNGVVDDMTLMAGANKLLGMQLVQTGDEAARMIEMAVKLGGAMGNNAAESVDSFAAMLANRSIERLDSFGISSGKVREEVEKLKASGMGMDEAFAFAVFEEGGKSLERLGSAANSSGAPVERLLTSVNNLLQDIGQNVATAVNGLVGIAEVGSGMFPGQAEAEAAANEAAMQNAELYIGAFKTAIWDAARGTDTANAMEDFLTVDPQILNRMLQPAIDAMRENPDLNLGEWVSGWLSQNGMPVDWSSGISQTIAAALEQAVPAVESTSKFIKTMGDNVGITSKRVQEATQSFQAMTGPISAARDATTSFSKELKMLNGGIAEENKLLPMIEAASAKYDLLMRDFASSEKDIGLMSGGGIGQYMARDTATAIQAEFESVQNQMQIMQSMFDQGLISEDQLNSAKDYAGAIKDMADEAGRAADALERASLSDIFGQSGGGRLGELTDNIVEQMRAAGKSDEDIAAVQAQLDMSSGRQTEASIAANAAYEKIAQLPPEQIAAATENLDKLLTWAASKNVEDSQLAWLIENRSGISSTGPGMQFTVNPGDTVSSLASMYNLSPEAIMQSTGITNPRLLQPGQYGAGESFAFNPIDFQSMGIPGLTGVDNEGTSAPEMMRETADAATDLSSSTYEISSNMETVNANTKEFVSSIQELAGKTTTVKINLDVDAGAFKAMLSQLGVNLDQVRSTRDNGGVVRGRDARVAE